MMGENGGACGDDATSALPMLMLDNVRLTGVVGDEQCRLISLWPSETY